MSEPEEPGLRIVVFDSGDIRCLSQLDLLEEILYRVQWKHKRDDPLLPCEYLHLIGGAGPAGIILAFLLSFRMSIQEAKEEFVKLWLAVFAEDGCDQDSRTSRLKEYLLDLLNQRGLAPEGEFLQPIGNTTCKGLIYVISPEAMDACEKLRTYRAHERGTNVTILQAIMATCATPALFSPVKVGDPPQQLTFIGGDSSFSNPTPQVIKEAHGLYGPKSTVSCVISLGAGKPNMKTTRNLADGGPFHLASLAASRTAEELESQLRMSRVYYRFSVDQGLEQPDSVALDNLGVIQTHTKAYIHQAKINGELDRCVDALEKKGEVMINDIYRAQARVSAVVSGLPPLCASFVMREQLLDSMTQSLFDLDEYSQRIMVLTGMGGSGKTQMVSKFARVHSDKFRNIFFIDASTFENIKNGIISKVRSLGATCRTLEEALDFLAHPDQQVDGPWLLILDNVDNPNISLSHFFPPCDSGFIIVTSRNPIHGDLSPAAHIQVDVMSESEAIEVLIRSAGIPSAGATERETARAISMELGHLPVALVQAGSFIKTNHCLDTYITRLRKHRNKILSRPARAQLDKHHHGIYMALDVTRPSLSARSLQLLSVLACLNYTGFPLTLIQRAGERAFTFIPYDLVNQTPEFQAAAEILRSIFTPDGEWDEQELDDLLAELEQFSLVVRVQTYSFWTLRFHPLVHAWMYDQILGEEREKYRQAALRLLLCGTSDEDEDIYEFILPHLSALSINWHVLSANDAAGIAKLASWEGDKDQAMEIWETLYTWVLDVHGPSHLRSIRAELQLASSHASFDDLDKAENMINKVINTRRKCLTETHEETVEANSYLAEKVLIRREWMLHNLIAWKLQNDSVQFWRKQSGSRPNLRTLHAMEVLAQMCQRIAKVHFQRKKWNNAYSLLDEVLQWRLLLHGEDHSLTLRTRALLAKFWAELDPSRMQQFLDLRSERYETDSGTDAGTNNHYAVGLLKERIESSKKLHGPYHINTIKALSSLAQFYETQAQHHEAATVWAETITSSENLYGRYHMTIARYLKSLAKCQELEGKHAEASTQWERIVEVYHTTRGELHVDTIQTMQRLASSYEKSDRYDKAESVWSLVKERCSLMICPHPEIILYSRRSLARLYEKWRMYKKAEFEWKDAITACETAYGSTHEETLRCMESLAQLYESEHRNEEGQTQWKAVIKRCRVELQHFWRQGPRERNDAPQENWNFISSPARRCYDRITEYWTQSIEELKVKYGEGDVNTLRAMETLARIYQWQEREGLASNQWRRVIKLRESGEKDLEGIEIRASKFEEQAELIAATEQSKYLIKIYASGYAHDRWREAIFAMESLVKLYVRRRAFQKVACWWRAIAWAYQPGKYGGEYRGNVTLEDLEKIYEAEMQRDQLNYVREIKMMYSDSDTAFPLVHLGSSFVETFPSRDLFRIAAGTSNRRVEFSNPDVVDALFVGLWLTNELPSTSFSYSAWLENRHTVRSVRW